MNNFRIAVIALLASASFGVQAAERTVTLDVENMTCVTCPLTVKVALKRVPGVRDATVDFDTKQARVTFDDAQANVQMLEKATADVGFPATPSK
jgi:mercuric ion binding protein